MSHPSRPLEPDSVASFPSRFPVPSLRRPGSVRLACVSSVRHHRFVAACGRRVREAYRRRPAMAPAAGLAGVHRATVYRWRTTVAFADARRAASAGSVGSTGRWLWRTPPQGRGDRPNGANAASEPLRRPDVGPRCETAAGRVQDELDSGPQADSSTLRGPPPPVAVGGILLTGAGSVDPAEMVLQTATIPASKPRSDRERLANGESGSFPRGRAKLVIGGSTGAVGANARAKPESRGSRATSRCKRPSGRTPVRAWQAARRSRGLGTSRCPGQPRRPSRRGSPRSRRPRRRPPRRPRPSRAR